MLNGISKADVAIKAHQLYSDKLWHRFGDLRVVYLRITSMTLRHALLAE